MTGRDNLWPALDAAELEVTYQHTTAIRQGAAVEGGAFYTTVETVVRNLAALLRESVGDDGAAQLAAGRALLAAASALGGLAQHEGEKGAPAGACLALVLNALGWTGCDLMDGDA